LLGRLQPEAPVYRERASDEERPQELLLSRHSNRLRVGQDAGHLPAAAQPFFHYNPEDIMKKNGNRVLSNQMQARYLKNLLEQAGRDHNSAIYELGKVAKPARVLEAERILKDYERRVSNAQHKLRQRLREKMQKDSAAVYKVILFGTPQEALAAVESFSKRTYG
jgi:hypothetical protein